MSVQTEVETDNIIVRTETSAYFIDYARKVIIRVPGKPEDVNSREAYVDYLRKDNEEIPFVDISEPVIGMPLQLLLKIREDGVLTHRVTTYVQEILPL